MRLSKERELAYIASGRIKLPAPKSVPVAQSKEHLNSSEAVEGSNPSGHTKRKPAHTPGKMNETEQKFAWMLEAKKVNHQIIAWKFEPHRLFLAHDTSYQPDFLVVHADGIMEYVEIKGAQVWEKNRIKFKVAREMYPGFKWTLMQLKKGAWEEVSKLPSEKGNQ